MTIIWLMYGSRDMKHDGQNFLSFWTVFLPFYPPNNPKNHNFEKLKKAPWYIITLHICTINDNQIMYGLYVTYLSTNNPKNEHFEKMKKKAWRYYHFTHVYHKWQSNGVWFLRYWARQVDFFVILDHFLPFYPCNNPKY